VGLSGVQACGTDWDGIGDLASKGFCSLCKTAQLFLVSYLGV